VKREEGANPSGVHNDCCVGVLSSYHGITINSIPGYTLTEFKDESRVLSYVVYGA